MRRSEEARDVSEGSDATTDRPTLWCLSTTSISRSPTFVVRARFSSAVFGLLGFESASVLSKAWKYLPRYRTGGLRSGASTIDYIALVSEPLYLNDVGMRRVIGWLLDFMDTRLCLGSGTSTMGCVALISDLLYLSDFSVRSLDSCLLSFMSDVSLCR